jgi:hypothetical protein
MENHNKGVKSRMKLQKDNVPNDISFHYTPEELVKYCLSFINFDNNDFVMDAGAGENKVWLNNIPTERKDWTEIDLGKDFLQYKENVDWVVGNPPYKGCWEFWQKSFQIANKGVGFLISINMFNKFTPKRLEEIKNQGFYMNKIVVVSCKKWFGRYFFVIFTKQPNKFIEWSNNNYG